MRVAVIGVGHLGRHHARILAEMPEVELTAVVDSNHERAREIAKERRTSGVADWRDVIEAEIVGVLCG